MLLQTGACGVPMEYLNPSSARYWCARFGTARLEKLFPHFVRLRTTPNGTFSLKAHWSQFQPFRDQVKLLTGGIGFDRIVWISRRNQLSQAISWVIAEQTGVWISGALATGVAKYDYLAITRVARAVRDSNLAWRDYLKLVNSEHVMPLVYEDLLADEILRDRLATFLDLPPTLSPAKRTRQQSSPLNDQWKKRFCEDITEEDRWILEAPAWLESEPVTRDKMAAKT
jgi:LPS sulfotransferase NodH